MSDGPTPEEKKIIIDEDWKSQVEAEKEAAREEPAAESAEAPADESVPLPPPTLTFLAGSLYLQGMMSLGLLPSPTSDEPQLDLPQAKHAVEALEMLYTKTEGNRTPEESHEMDRMLHELRLAYVGTKDSAGE